ncbi:hypothetical protein HYFRA_00009036 [Hymenoscyphus fraxineus]|uniref:Polyketide synthase n=1 Tax=Hymenoscyphus fraxineus TaxID=746836 RepID=A0A9N9PMV9_9HELO|nr:hypothetical protein HYFRA_00009036 [Hymenoscyphus fraxineus]
MMEPIAIVGYSFRLPQDAEDTSSFWEMLEAGKNVMTEWPASRINIDAFHAKGSSKQKTFQARGAHFLKDDPGYFDAPFFGIPSDDAAAMDPQQRMMLETSYRALENAGLSMATVNGSQTAVFEASMVDDFNKFMSKDADYMARTTATGTQHSIMANRISWFFNLHGPSLHIDTACSSSMVALDMACQSLTTKNSSMALVACSNLLLGPEGSLMLSQMNFLSPDSLCYSFDHRANGYARGEGTIVMVLKRLTDALSSEDTIRAVIRATGTNQDGHTPGITQPSSNAQERLIRDVYRKACLGFESTRYIEAHGTGTKLGDPLEMSAIGRVFRTSRSPDEPLYVGSVKSSIGHTEGASGLAGILKAILMLEKGVIPPNALFEKANPDLDLEFYNTQIPNKCIPWPTKGLRRISVNSFGFGGTNSHAILDDALHFLEEHDLVGNHCTSPLPPDGAEGQIRSVGCTTSNGINGATHLENGNTEVATTDSEHDYSTKSEPISNGVSVPQEFLRALVFSAADEASLTRMIESYKSYYRDKVLGDEEKIDQLAYTLSARRSDMLWKSFTLVAPTSEDELSVSKPVRSTNQTGMVFIFTGQGAQYAKMGLGLMQFPIFKATLAKANEIFAKLGCTWSLIDELRESHNISRPEYSQALCTALQIALVELLKAVDITPIAVVGHSSGEIAAAYTIGALSIESACKVAYYRGLLAGRLAATTAIPGAMISVNIAEEEVSGYLQEKFGDCGAHLNLTVACINSPSNVTISGDEVAINNLKDKLDEDGIFAVKLKTGVAYHSNAMKTISSDYLNLMGTLEPTSSKRLAIPMISTVTSNAVALKTLSRPDYWVSNLVSPVRFSDAVKTVVSISSQVKLGTSRARPAYDLVEIGPHSALRRYCKEILETVPRKKEVRYTSALHRQIPPVQAVLELIGKLFTYGYKVSVTEANRLRFGNKRGNRFLVDTPEYPFDHSQRYWYESRTSLEYRTRQPVPRDVLGTRVQDWNPLEPKWRKFISVEDLPWVSDHVIGGTVLFPATGMIMMAIEAVKQIAPKDRQICAYLVKEALISSPIVVSANEEGRDVIEAVISLRRLQKPFEKESVWSEVWISTYSKKSWTECFRATIQTQYREAQSQVDDGLEGDLNHKAAFEAYTNATGVCSKRITADSFYRYCKDSGLSYGASFRLLETIRWDGKDTAIGNVGISKSTLQYGGLVHPAILDAACQIFYTAPSKGLMDKMPTLVPHKFKDMYLAARGWNASEISQIRILNESRYQAVGRGVEGSLTILADDGSLMCKVRKLEMSVLADDDGERLKDRKLLFGIRWKPCLSELDPAQLNILCNTNISPVDESATIEFYHTLDNAVRRVVSNTLSRLSENDRQSAPLNMQRLIVWLESHQLPNFALEAFEDIDETSTDQIFRGLEIMKPDWNLFGAVARSFPEILRGEINPLTLHSTKSLSDRLYAEILTKICDNNKFRTLIDLASHQNPGMRILEIGTGSGGFTSQVLSVLESFESESGGSRLSEYVYTDASSTYFYEAKSKFPQAASRMDFRTLDLEQDIVSQDFEAGGYDLVICSSPLHATPDLKSTLQNIRKVLKPGGKLIFIESIDPDSFAINFAFGIIPSWWKSKEPWRTEGPIINEEQWNSVLQESGFSGNDLVLRDFENQRCHNFSVICSTANETTTLDAGLFNGRIIIVVEEDSAVQSSVAQSLCKEAFEHHYHTEIWAFTHEDISHISSDDIVVVLSEIGQSIFAQPELGPIFTETRFKTLQELLRMARKVLWVTSINLIDTKYPYMGISDGLLRVVRSEANDKQIVSLRLEGTRSGGSEAWEHIAKVFTNSFEQGSTEVEYMVQDGCLMVGRLVEESVLNDQLISTIHPHLHSAPWGEGPALMLTVQTPGTLDTLQFVRDPVVEKPLGPEEVEIEALAWGLTFRDVFIALGRLPEDDYGFDCSGVVTRVGAHVTTVIPGDRVCMTCPGCMRRFPRCHYLELIKIPEPWSFEDAVAIAAGGVTAYHSLIDMARLRTGEKVLIHSASGATGQLAVQIAQMVGAEVFATVGLDEKKQLLIDEFGLAADHIFYSRNTSFAQGVLRLTGGYGVDVVLNSLSGDGLQASWEIMAPYGRFIEIGKIDIKSNSGLPMCGFAKNVSFAAVDLHHVAKSRGDITQKLLSDCMRLLSNGSIKPPTPVHVYPVSRVESAFRYLQSGKNTGRIVITNKPTDIVTVIHVPDSLIASFIHTNKKQKSLTAPHTWKFDGNASYLVVGGLGGIGRAISQWMMRRGAKNLILPSRSGAVSQAKINLVAKLTENHVHVETPRCDLSSTEEFIAMLKSCAITMPPIKGCINAAMVLQDVIFENMTHKQWETTIRSKVHTSWNLHTLLPSNLDFFILLSSLSGIYGGISQANYAAGNTFQDALARYRVSRGQKATSFDLGWMRTIGVIAENEEYQNHRVMEGDMAKIEEDEILSLFEIYCNPSHPVLSPDESQILVGVITPRDYFEQGTEQPDMMRHPLFSSFGRVSGSTDASEEGDGTDCTVRFKKAETEGQRTDVVVSALVAKLARSLSMVADDVDPSKKLFEYGVDSLVAVELRNWIAKQFMAEVAVFDIMGGSSITDVSVLVTKRSSINDKKSI